MSDPAAPRRPSPAGAALAGAAAAFYSSYGMLVVLAALVVAFAYATYRQETPTGAEGARQLASDALVRGARSLVIVATPDAAGSQFARTLASASRGAGGAAAHVVLGGPPEVRARLADLAAQGHPVGIVATTPECRQWAVWDALRRSGPEFAALRVVAPQPRARSAFLSPGNLRNVADQIAVIAIIAVGMTLVILTGGIDLSVGSLIALSAVVTAWLIRAWGGANATGLAMAGASAAAIALCGAVGAFSGAAITRFRVPPFIATLAMMQVASGLAFIAAQGQSIYDIPPAFTWLGRGTDLLTLPNAVALMAVIYAAAHVAMTRTAVGRHIYAVGGSAEAARLSGVPTRRTLLLVYIVSGLTAGVGGVITASQLKAGSPTYGASYELYVIAAVVVGGTSLSGGQGRVLGTLIGAFIIAVIRNGMNLTDVEAYTQKVVLGLVILGAVLLDMLKRRKGIAA